MGICGNADQANYAAANIFLDGFAQYRRQLGLPSSVTALGAVGETCRLAQDAKVLQTMKSFGFWLLSEDEVLKGLKQCIGEFNIANSTKFDTQFSAPLIIGLGTTKPLSVPGAQTVWRRDARLASHAILDSTSVNKRAVPV